MNFYSKLRQIIEVDNLKLFFGKDSFYKKLADKTLYNNYYVKMIFENRILQAQIV